MNKYLELNTELNDLMYEVKITIPKHHPLQKRIDEVMAKYQKEFRELYQLKGKE